jgi:hypothetical protein
MTHENTILLGGEFLQVWGHKPEYVEDPEGEEHRVDITVNP